MVLSNISICSRQNTSLHLQSHHDPHMDRITKIVSYPVLDRARRNQEALEPRN